MKDKLLEIINHYGVMHQLKYFQSEVFELNEAIIQYENTDTINKKHIAEEIADVCVLLNQIIEYYKISRADINMNMVFKIDRQLDRIKGEQNEE